MDGEQFDCHELTAEWHVEPMFLTCLTILRGQSRSRGSVLIPVLVFGSAGIIMLGGFVGWAGISVRDSQRAVVRERALQAAEAGIDYYRWHLAHAPQDFQDGTGGPGPYAHDVKDKDGNVIGQFVLEITPPPLGSTAVVVRSSGSINIAPAIVRTIETRLAIPTIAQYAVVSNSTIRFGSGTDVSGPIHSNGGIRFDGLAHNVVTSARDKYDDPDHSGGDEFGVHTHVAPVDPAPPNPVPSRTDVFEASRVFPMPQVDFSGITADLAEMKALAQAGGVYLASSGALGYHLVLKTNDTVDIYRVNTLVPVPSGCTASSSQLWWGTWSIAAGGETLLQNVPLPANGIIFTEDHVWVNGQIDSARVTIASGRFPDSSSTRTSITVNNDLLYTNYDGQDVIGLIAQANINAGLVSENDLRIDAALIAQNGRVGRYYYRAPSGGSNRCAPYHIRQTITLFGMIATFERYGFAYTDGTGYQTRNIVYDANLLYGPPPNFPLTADEYAILSWEEVR